MVGQDFDSLWGPFEVWAPVLKTRDDCQHLFVVDRVVELRASHGLGIIGYWMPLPIGLFLGKDASNYAVGSVGF